MKIMIGRLAVTVLVAAAVSLTGCNADNDSPSGEGPAGVPGADGERGFDSLLVQKTLSTGSSQCVKGGVQIDSGLDLDRNGVLASDEVEHSRYICNPSFPNFEKHFNRLASYPVCGQLQGDCDTDQVTAAEIVAASADGATLIYTDSPSEQVGFVDIADPSDPRGLGMLALPGEPTSVAVKDGYALVGVNTSENYIDTAGELAVVDIATQTVVARLDVGGQPDSVAVSPDGLYAVVVIENERDEDLGDGAPPQAPAGNLVVVNLNGEPASWVTQVVDLDGLAALYPEDPEPEYVDINYQNIAVVTLQENNHLVLVELATAEVIRHFSAGVVDLTGIDALEGDLAKVSLTDSVDAVPREPDGVAWINDDYFATADEGDLHGGSRGFTIFNTLGEVVYTSGNELDHRAVRLGHYPDSRSENKGNEPENIEVGIYGGERYLFVASERASLVFVYDVADPINPIYKQTLPAALGPEGVLAIPSRNLLVAASEEDSRADGFRSALNIYHYSTSQASYPALVSTDNIDGTPIAWSAQSGLAADPQRESVLYSVDDSYFGSNRIFTIDTQSHPARIIEDMLIRDSNDVLATLTVAALEDASVPADHATRVDVFDEADLAAMINADKTLNLDPEGISRAADGGFWIVSEGSGTMGDVARPINSVNLLFKLDRRGVIQQVFTLPDAMNNIQLRFGFEGVAEYDGLVYVAFQRAWGDQPEPRIGVLNPADGSWEFYCYPLDTVESANGGWVGLSDIAALGDGQFMVVERDNQSGPDAAIKRLYRFDVTGLNDGDTLSKTLVRDLLGDLKNSGGLVPEKIEGLAITVSGDVWISNDNDGVDDNSGENLLLNLGQIAQ